MASQAKLNIVLKMTKEAMEDIGLQWNPKKCNVLNVRRGVPVDIPEGFKSGKTVIDSLKEDTETATSRRKAGSAVYFQDLPAETLGYLVEPTVRHQQSSSVQSACHASTVVPYVVPTLVSDRLARHR